MKYVSSALIFSVAFALTEPASAFAPPPEEAEAEPEVIVLYDINEERADRVQEEISSEDPTCPVYEQAPQILVPVTDNNTLVGYAFVTPRFCFSRGTNRYSASESMHFVYDNLVRAAHRTPFVRAEDNTLDKSSTSVALLSAAREIMGEERLDRLDLLGSDVRYMR